MPGSAGTMSIFTLPRYLCALHNLRLAFGATREFSTSYSDRTEPLLQRSCTALIPKTQRKRDPQKLWRRYESSSSATEHSPSSPKKRSEPKWKRDPKPKREFKTERPQKHYNEKRTNTNRQGTKPKKTESWEIQKEALKTKFKEGWNPRKKLSQDAMDGVRQLHKSDPVKFSTPVLAEHFKVSPEAIRRILKTKWRPNEQELKNRQERWERRNAKIWNQMAELGLRPQREGLAPLSDVERLKDESEHEPPSPKDDK